MKEIIFKDVMCGITPEAAYARLVKERTYLLNCNLGHSVIEFRGTINDVIKLSRSFSGQYGKGNKDEANYITCYIEYDSKLIDTAYVFFGYTEIEV